MLEIISDIEKSIECGCYLSALALALTIPDICGEIECSLSNSEKKRNVGKRYKKWFEDWVEHYYADHTGYIDDGRKAKNPYFNAKMCYELRCGFLHAGDPNINDFGEKENDEFIYNYSFKLCVNGCNMYGEHWFDPQKTSKKEVTKTVRIDVGKLCRDICESARAFYKEKGSGVFINKRIKVLDIENEAKKMKILK